MVLHRRLFVAHGIFKLAKLECEAQLRIIWKELGHPSKAKSTCKRHSVRENMYTPGHCMLHPGVGCTAPNQCCQEFRLVGEAHCKDTLPLKGGWEEGAKRSHYLKELETFCSAFCWSLEVHVHIESITVSTELLSHQTWKQTQAQYHTSINIKCLYSIRNIIQRIWNVKGSQYRTWRMASDKVYR